MERNFEQSLKLVLKHEGGFVNHPRDPGGATNKGITIANFRRYVKPGGTVKDLKNISDAEVAKVYRKHYWDKVKADYLPGGVDYATFDFAVNSGPSRAAKFLQNAVGVKADGQIGPVTLKATNGLPAKTTIFKLCNARLVWLRRLKTFSTFGKGWTRRVNDVLVAAGQMATDRQPDDPGSVAAGKTDAKTAVKVGVAVGIGTALATWAKTQGWLEWLF